MSQFPHDQFAKDLLETLLSPFGWVETDRKISSEVREIDVCFFPHPQTTAPPTLGLLSRLASTGTAFEPFRNPVAADEIRSCISKFYAWQVELQRLAKRGLLPLSAGLPLTRLWILTPTLAAATLEGFGAITDLATWGRGVYLLPAELATGIVVIHQLPETDDTLWLRVLGKHKVQERAVEEIHRLTQAHPHRQQALELLADLQVVLEAKQDRDRQETELLMSLRTSPQYLEHMERATQKGVAVGRREGERELVLKQLTRKLGMLSPELIAQINQLSLDRLEALGEALLDFQKLEDLQQWLGRSI
jgi:hypothetical protein